MFVLVNNRFSTKKASHKHCLWPAQKGYSIYSGVLEFNFAFCFQRAKFRIAFIAFFPRIS
jgi:hypothetical protein